MPYKMRLKIRKRSLLWTIEGELEIEAETVDDLLKIAKNRPEFKID